MINLKDKRIIDKLNKYLNDPKFIEALDSEDPFEALDELFIDHDREDLLWIFQMIHIEDPFKYPYPKWVRFTGDEGFLLLDEPEDYPQNDWIGCPIGSIGSSLLMGLYAYDSRYTSIVEGAPDYSNINYLDLQTNIHISGPIDDPIEEPLNPNSYLVSIETTDLEGYNAIQTLPQHFCNCFIPDSEKGRCRLNKSLFKKKLNEFFLNMNKELYV